MLTSQPHLTIRRPSPTTIEYTVSTYPPPTLPTRLLLLLVALIRLALTLSTLLVLYSAWRLSPYSSPLPPLSSPSTPISTSTSPNDPTPFLSSQTFFHYLHALHLSPLGLLHTNLAAKTPLLLLIPSSAWLLLLLLTPIHTTETLLVLRGLGIQTSSSPTLYAFTSSTRFIPTSRIQDVFINEVFKGLEVRYMLGVVVRGEEEVVVVFPRLLPGRGVVERVWRGTKGGLWGAGKAVGEVGESEKTSEVGR